MMLSSCAHSLSSKSPLLSHGLGRASILSTQLVAKQPALDTQLQQQRGKFKYPRFTKINFSKETGFGENFQPAVDRFFRLNNGYWIRTQTKKRTSLYDKDPKRRLKSQQHLICTETQARMLDRMVEEEYRLPKYIPDDPYRAYHKLSNVRGYKYVPKQFYP